MKNIFGVLTAAFLITATSWAADPSLQPCHPTAEKAVGAGPLLQMVVFGDSVAWGNGLAETGDETSGHKFSALVADWLAKTTNRQVKRAVYAHSAATVQPPEGVPETTQPLAGDVNSAYPTVSEQLGCVAEEQRANVRLILMNGCINDVGPFGLVSPENPASWVQYQVEQFCGPPIEQVLRTAAQMYQHATIVVTGYYPIISDKSDIAPFLDFLRQFFPAQSKRSMYLFRQADVQEAMQEKSRSAENSSLFYNLTNQLFSQSVDRINRELGNTRLYFVKIPLTPENSFGAPQSYLWPIPTVVSGFDEVYLDRQIPCLNAFAKDPVGFEVCRLDSAAHPNVEGAHVYADEIIKVLADFARQAVDNSGK